MKKNVLITIIVSIVTFVVGFFVGDTTAINRVNKAISASVKTETNNSSSKATDETKEAAKKTPPVTIEQVPYTIKMREPDSIGTRYMDATYTNNSKSTIKGMNITVLLKDKNEKVFLSNYDTMLPGATSSKFNTFAPKSGNEGDMEVLKIEITVVNADGSNTYVEYDSKLKTYTWN